MVAAVLGIWGTSVQEAIYPIYSVDAEGQKLEGANRYPLNSPMLPQFKRDADGGITFTIQHESPGADNEANWLPLPKGPFSSSMRLYWPKPEALEGTWKLPPMQRVNY